MLKSSDPENPQKYLFKIRWNQCSMQGAGEHDHGLRGRVQHLRQRGGHCTDTQDWIRQAVVFRLNVILAQVIIYHRYT